jgi:hypothetical protein
MTTDYEPMLQFFAYGHLPERLARISRPFGEMAHAMCNELPRNPERTAGLRKLLEAKDCAIRAHLYTTDMVELDAKRPIDPAKRSGCEA